MVDRPVVTCVVYYVPKIVFTGALNVLLRFPIAHSLQALGHFGCSCQLDSARLVWVN